MLGATNFPAGLLCVAWEAGCRERRASTNGDPGARVPLAGKSPKYEAHALAGKWAARGWLFPFEMLAVLTGPGAVRG